MYTWVKRASATEKIQMQEVVDSFNELANEHTDMPFISFYRLERCGDSWGMVEYVDVPSVEWSDYYNHGQRMETISFVRCDNCGGVRELMDGQIEFCYYCDADWTRPLTMKAKKLYDEYKENAPWMSRTEIRTFKARVTKLSHRISGNDKDCQFALMYLDSLTVFLDMVIC
jgi:hypothetical protein